MKKIVLFFTLLFVPLCAIAETYIPYASTAIYVTGNTYNAYTVKTFSADENLIVCQIDTNPPAGCVSGLDVRMAAVAVPNTYTAGSEYQTLFANPVSTEKVFFLTTIKTQGSTQNTYWNLTCVAKERIEVRTYKYVP
jgi:hypothetical protein